LVTTSILGRPIGAHKFRHATDTLYKNANLNHDETRYFNEVAQHSEKTAKMYNKPLEGQRLQMATKLHDVIHSAMIEVGHPVPAIAIDDTLRVPMVAARVVSAAASEIERLRARIRELEQQSEGGKFPIV